MSKSLALCSAVRKFFSTDKRSGATVMKEKIEGEYEPKASSLSDYVKMIKSEEEGKLFLEVINQAKANFFQESDISSSKNRS